jgi:hypothetical protein
MKDSETTSSLNDIGAVSDTLQHALRRIDFVISEVGQHGGILSYVETSKLKDGLKVLGEIKCSAKEMFISLRLLLHEFKTSC